MKGRGPSEDDESGAQRMPPHEVAQKIIVKGPGKNSDVCRWPARVRIKEREIRQNYMCS